LRVRRGARAGVSGARGMVGACVARVIGCNEAVDIGLNARLVGGIVGGDRDGGGGGSGVHDDGYHGAVDLVGDRYHGIGLDSGCTRVGADRNVSKLFCDGFRFFGAGEGVVGHIHIGRHDTRHTIEFEILIIVYHRFFFTWVI